MNDLIRCIDTKTNKERFLPPKIVADKKLMASYNLIVQDNNKNEELVKEVISESETVITSDFEEVAETSKELPKKGRPKVNQ